MGYLILPLLLGGCSGCRGDGRGPGGLVPVAAPSSIWTPTRGSRPIPTSPSRATSSWRPDQRPLGPGRALGGGRWRGPSFGHRVSPLRRPHGADRGRSVQLRPGRGHGPHRAHAEHVRAGDHVWVRRRRVPLTAGQSARLTAFVERQDGKPFAVLRLMGQVTPFRSRGPAADLVRRRAERRSRRLVLFGVGRGVVRRGRPDGRRHRPPLGHLPARPVLRSLAEPVPRRAPRPGRMGSAGGVVREP